MTLIAKTTTIPTNTGVINTNNVNLTKVVANGIVVWEKDLVKEYLWLSTTSSVINLILNCDAASEEDDSFNELRTKFYKIPTDIITNGEMIECSGQYLYINCSLYNDKEYSTYLDLGFTDENNIYYEYCHLFSNRGYDNEHKWRSTDTTSPKYVKLPDSGKYYITLFLRSAGYHNSAHNVGWKMSELKIIKDKPLLGSEITSFAGKDYSPQINNPFYS